MKVSDYLKVEYGVLIIGGKKQKCPFCFSKNKTLSLRKDNTLAKCFRCGNFLIMSSDGTLFNSYNQKRIKL